MLGFLANIQADSTYFSFNSNGNDFIQSIRVETEGETRLGYPPSAKPVRLNRRQLKTNHLPKNKTPSIPNKIPLYFLILLKKLQSAQNVTGTEVRPLDGNARFY